MRAGILSVRLSSLNYLNKHTFPKIGKVTSKWDYKIVSVFGSTVKRDNMGLTRNMGHWKRETDIDSVCLPPTQFVPEVPFCPHWRHLKKRTTNSAISDENKKRKKNLKKCKSVYSNHFSTFPGLCLPLENQGNWMMMIMIMRWIQSMNGLDVGLYRKRANNVKVRCLNV